MKILIIANSVYLPISKGYGDTSEQKYFGSSTKGEVFIDQIFTETEVKNRALKSGLKLKEANNLFEVENAWNSPD